MPPLPLFCFPTIGCHRGRRTEAEADKQPCTDRAIPGNKLGGTRTQCTNFSPLLSIVLGATHQSIGQTSELRLLGHSPDHTSVRSAETLLRPRPLRHHEQQGLANASFLLLCGC